jgi:hypothetical protein
VGDAFIFYSDFDRFEIRSQSNYGFEEEFTTLIPHAYREWLFQQKTWRFAGDYLLQVHAIAKKHFSDVQLDTETLNYLKGKFEEQENNTPDKPYAMLYLRDTAPLWLAEKVYKILVSDTRSIYLHQDLGGANPEKTSEINEAIERIRKKETD